MIKIATVFSGIGSVEYALRKLKLEHEIKFACDNGERELDISENDIKAMLINKTDEEKKNIIDELYRETGKINFVKSSYMANYNIDENLFYQDVRFINGELYKNKITLFVGGSPCQSFSQSGKQLGFDDIRGTLFFEYIRLIKEINPKIFIYENVPNILKHDHGKTWETMENIFNELDYTWDKFLLNAKDYGIPQNRKRVFVIGIRNDLNVNTIIPPKPKKLKKQAKDFYEKKIDNKYYHGKKGVEWVSNPKHIGKRVGINNTITRTQTANQQFNWCGDVVFEALEETNCSVNDKKIHIGEHKGKRGVFRKLTPKECLSLMGFEEFEIVVKDTEIYRQSGNSIVVNIFEAILSDLLEMGLLND